MQHSKFLSCASGYEPTIVPLSWDRSNSTQQNSVRPLYLQVLDGPALSSAPLEDGNRVLDDMQRTHSQGSPGAKVAALFQTSQQMSTIEV